MPPGTGGLFLVSAGVFERRESNEQSWAVWQAAGGGSTGKACRTGPYLDFGPPPGPGRGLL